MVIRGATADDVGFVERTGREAFAEFDPHAGAHSRAIVRQPGTVTLIASVDGRPSGFIAIERVGRGALVQAIAVRRVDRGRGLGARLLSAAERIARDGGARTLSLATAQANVEALSLFLKADFEIERRMQRFYARGQDACWLVKRLDA